MGRSAFGLAVGPVLAVGTGERVRNLMFAVEPADPGVLAGVAALMGAVAMVSCYVPSRRALRVDPAEALRAA